MKENKIHHMDWMNNQLPDKSVQLIIADPPYFEVKGEFDFVWKSFDDYLQDVEKWAIECKRILADNGTLFWWGHAKKIAYTQVILDKYFNLENSIVWEKIDSIQMTMGSIDVNRSFTTHNERLLMYSNEVGMTGLQEIYSDDNCFESIKEYLRSEKQKSKLTSKQLNYMFSKYTNKEGCLDRSVMEHYWQKSQWVFPTQEIYENIMQPTGFWQKTYEALRQEYEALRQEYEALRQEYEEQRRYFYNELKLSEVFTFSQEGHITKQYDHETKKPEKLTRALILTCSRENDLVFVPFAGSGTECAMAIKEKRRFIGFDVNEKYVEMANRRVRKIASEPTLF
jgi:site-specific DNA-methyltransferase (adenine-specific)